MYSGEGLGDGGLGAQVTPSGPFAFILDQIHTDAYRARQAGQDSSPYIARALRVAAGAASLLGGGPCNGGPTSEDVIKAVQIAGYVAQYGSTATQLQFLAGWNHFFDGWRVRNRDELHVGACLFLMLAQQLSPPGR